MGEMTMLFQATMGSVGRNLARPGSDVDLRGVYIYPASDYWSLTGVPEFIKSDDSDTLYHEAKRYARLLRNAKTEEIEMLFSRPEFMHIFHDPIKVLTNNRDVFIDMRLADTYRRSSMGMMKRDMSWKQYGEAIRRWICMNDILEGRRPTTWFEGENRHNLAGFRALGDQTVDDDMWSDRMIDIRDFKFDFDPNPDPMIDVVLEEFLNQCRILSEKL